MSILTSKEMFINMKNPPKYNPRKNYFDQTKEVLDFYNEERRKIEDGVYIGGYFVHPWLYFHLNFFKTPLPQIDKSNKEIKKAREVIMNPPLDDNFLYIIDSYREAEQTNKGLCLFGTRGFGKALRNDEVLLYEDKSWKPIGEAKVGDRIYGANGELTTIKGVYPQGSVPSYKVTLRDGREVYCCDEHLWYVYDFQARRNKVLPLKEIIKHYKYTRTYTGNKYKDGKDRIAEVPNYYIPKNDCIEFNKEELPLRS